MRSRLLLLALAGLIGLCLVAYRARRGVEGLGTPTPAVRVAAGAPEAETPLEVDARAKPPSPARGGASGADASADEPGPGLLRVQGIVLDPDGKPFARGTTTCWVPALPGTHGWRYSRTFNNGKDGRFEFHPPEAGLGELHLVAHASDWDDSEELTLTRAELERAGEIRLVLRRFGSIRGIALDLLGRPLEGRDVLLDLASVQPGHGVASAAVDSSGAFAFDAVRSGTHQLSAQPGFELGLTISRECLALAQVVNGIEAHASVAVPSALEARVTLGGPCAGCVRVHGRITRAGEPVRGAWIWVEPGEGRSRLSWTRCDDAGAYELGVESPGPARVRIGPGANGGLLVLPVVIPAAPEFELDIPLGEGRIDCRVVDSEEHPVPRVQVSLIVHDSEHAAGRPASASSLASTDEQGRVSFHSLAPGTYELRAGGLSRARASSGLVVLAEGDAHEQRTLVLGRKCTLRGALLGGPDEPTREGSVDVFDAAGNYLTRVACDTDLHFGAEDLAPGSYRLVGHLRDLASPVSALVEVGTESVAWVELPLEAATEVCVRVLDSSGAPCERYRESLRERGGLCLSEGEIEHPGTEWVLLGSLPRGSFVLEIRAGPGRTLEKQLELLGEKRLELQLELPAETAPAPR